MFLELRDKNSTYRKEYFNMLKYRLAYGSLEVEGIEGDLADTSQSFKIYNQLTAINYIFENANEDRLEPFEFLSLLCKVVELVTGGEIDNFRTTNVYVNGSKVKRSAPGSIRTDLYYLIDDYNYRIANCKTQDEIYEAEAQFHIRLLHIHPFQDGNGRTARIFLAYNMCKNDLAPCIITKEIKRKYCDFIENNDIKGLGELFKSLSQKELDTMVALYKQLDDKGLIETNIPYIQAEETHSQKKR